MTSAAQIKAIHALKTRTGLGEADYRGMLGRFGKRSSKDLSDREAVGLIDDLKRLPGAQAGGGRSAAATASGPYAPVLRALWIAAWNLALARSPEDAAMMRFVARQTGASHTRFLVEAADAAKAIEALKAWLARDGGVEWPKGDDPIDRKAAVCRAVARRLQDARGFTPFLAGADIWPRDVALYAYRRGLPAGFEHYSGEHWDRLGAMLGRRLRGTLAARSREEAHA